MKLIYQVKDRQHEYGLDAQPKGTIGRSRANTLRIKDHNVSRTHIKFELRAERLLVEDMDSRNGLFVNGLRVTEAELKPGDEFALGGFKVRFDVGAPAPGTAPAPSATDADDDDEEPGFVVKGPAVDPEAATALEVKLGAAGPAAVAAPAPAPAAFAPPPAAPPTPAPVAAAAPAPTPPPQAAAPSSGSAVRVRPPAAPPVDASRVPVLLVKQDGVTSEFVVRFQRVSIGTNPDNDLVLDVGKVSRYHAEIRQVDQLWILRDLGSKNGTLVNGQKIEEAVLNDGDRLEVGTSQLTFKWSAQAAPAPRRNAVKLGVYGAASLAGLVGLALLAAPFVVGSSKPTANTAPTPRPSEDKAYEEFLVTGSQRLQGALEDGKFDAARRNFEQAAKLKSEAAPLGELVALLEKHAADRAATPWEELNAHVESARKIPDLPSEARAVLGTLADTAQREARCARLYGDVVVLLDGKEYEKALAAIRDIPADSLYHAKISPQMPDIRSRLKAGYVTRIDALIRDRKLQPALDLIAKAQDASDILDQDLHHKKLLCQKEIDDSKRLADAHAAVEVGSIPEARTLLAKIDPKSFCYNDAQQLLERLDLELLLREVRGLYKEGKGDQAVARIRMAKVQTGELKSLAEKVESVVKLYEEGMQAREERNFSASRAAGKSLVRLEPDPENWYHQAGTDLQSETPEELAGRALRAAKDRLAKQDFPGARMRFQEALGHLPGLREATDGLKKLAEQTSREYNRVINDKSVSPEQALTRLREIRQWVADEDRLARTIDAKIRELDGK